MVPSKQSTFANHPVFMMRLGARFVFRIHVASGSRRGWVPVMLTRPIKMRFWFARSDEGDALEVQKPPPSPSFPPPGIIQTSQSKPSRNPLTGKEQLCRQVVGGMQASCCVQLGTE